MEIAGLDHVTIRCTPEAVPELRAFYEDIIGLRVGPRRLTFPGVWLYAGDTAVVHVAGNLEESLPTVAVLDHFALRARGLQDMQRKLDAAGVEWREVWRPEQEILQLVLHDPAGVKIELAFDPAEKS